ncbi:hypothetical protein BDQ94DRAFT_144756, partial [Aspergillus welwitschiae]
MIGPGNPGRKLVGRLGSSLMLLQSDKRRSSGHYHRSQLSVRLGRRVPRADFGVSLLFVFAFWLRGLVMLSCVHVMGGKYILFFFLEILVDVI